MLTYNMEDRGRKTKTIFLYGQIKNDIISGALAAGEKLPSKRELADHLSVSVITVENAYIMLEEEGYIKAVPKKGFFVKKLDLPEKNAPQQERPAHISDEASQPPASRAGRAYFPAMAKIYRRILSEQPEILQTKPPRLGCAVLRNAIADYLYRYRNMHVQPANIIIGSGSEYLYGMIVQLFGTDCIYGIEDPSYEKIRRVYASNGVSVDLLKMGSEGILSSELERTGSRVLHVTPYHSFPTGVTADAEKRYEYLGWADRNSGYIIEDDFDSEYAFYRKPINTLYAMDDSGRVIYMNTFTKSLSPAIRTAYMILPDDLMKLYIEKLGFYSCPVPVLDQYVLASFIESGAFERHLNRIRRSSVPKSI